jgi:hypothetical protein
MNRHAEDQPELARARQVLTAQTFKLMLGELRMVTAGPIVILSFDPKIASSSRLPDDYL